MERHVYGELSNGEFRLLRVQNLEPLSCELIVADLKDNVPYQALSYAWADQTPTQQILLDQRPFHITQNLHDAIYHIAKYTNCHYLLWCDLICIDQHNSHERNKQVQLMTKIFRQAESVRAWLGRASNKSNKAIEHMHSMVAYADGIWDNLSESIDENVNQEIYVASGLFNQDDSELLGENAIDQWWTIAEFLNSMWFERCWVVQEATAPGNLWMHCGDSVVSRGILWKLYLIVRQLGAYSVAELVMIEILGRIAKLSLIYHYRCADVDVSLLEVLNLMRNFDCQNPKDRIHAARGIATDVSHLELMPNYNQTTEECFLDTVRFLFKRTPSDQCLDFLGHALGTAISNRSPSERVSDVTWLPSWDVTGRPRPFATYVFADRRSNKAIIKAYDASRGSTPRVSMVSKVLRARGLIIDRVASMGSVGNYLYLSHQLTAKKDRRIPLTYIRDPGWFPEREEETYMLGGTKLDAWKHCVTADVLHSDSESIRRDCSIDHPDLIDEIDHDLDGNIYTPKQKTIVALKRSSVIAATHGRRMFQTRTGLMGLGPADMQVGDDVCILYGGQMIYVLRKVANPYWKYVGDAYVHGIMDGEALEETENFLNVAHDFQIV